MSDFTDKDFTTLIFLPTEVDKVKSIYLHGETEICDKTITIYVTETCKKKCKNCLGIYETQGCYVDGGSADLWIHLSKRDDYLVLSKYKLGGEVKSSDGVVLIHYDRNVFIRSHNSLLMEGSVYVKKDHFKSLINKLAPKNNALKEDCSKLVRLFKSIILLLSCISKKLLFVTKYSALAVHTDTYLNGLLWLTECSNDKREHIKKLNFILSLIIDVAFGALFLSYLTSQFSADSFLRFLEFTEDVIQSLRNLIHWLTGDPAGFKLNFIFSKMLATFILFYIDVWCAFIAILRPMYDVVFMVYLLIGKVGITFQMSILIDVLAVVTFHIYCICLFSARLYNIQVSALVALWRLFLGRKKNPLRGRVDSCKYTPEQLFIGTLGFTILLFLLPTTSIYYIVFTTLRIILAALRGTLTRIRYFVPSLQIYSLMLWLFRSPKVCTSVHLMPHKNPGLLEINAKPVCSSWRETIHHDRVDFCIKPPELRLGDFFYSLLCGTVNDEKRHENK